MPLEREDRIYKEHSPLEVRCSVCGEAKIDIVGIEAILVSIKLCEDCARLVGQMAEEEGID